MRRLEKSQFSKLIEEKNKAIIKEGGEVQSITLKGKPNIKRRRKIVQRKHYYGFCPNCQNTLVKNGKNAACSKCGYKISRSILLQKRKERESKY